ncbi:LacI family DNA-binding transcriptional regulator [Sphingobacterium bovistauri]|uniref:LacI family DNA-binding transcriptional regulator n=1 Tax=Sphingobacterium bovistauri TaxID=2781959 RepID=A0ABS7Z8J5_9SPHI|nr:LacI family DNA-binding transcriptional regulator [Sphingobacterium bovistauri]MCA5006318.1 LacI family DNA-binding transcriptional regulator [Sphingobacterium bovistauri]
MSINEIAKYLKVSKSTVSLVINGKAEQGRISKALAKRILDYVEEIGYKPNALAQSLATGKSKTIGLIVENIGDSFFGPIALYIEENLRRYGYQVFYSSTMGDTKISNEILETMIEKKVEGIIISPAVGQLKNIQKIRNKNFPLVVFDRRVIGLSTNYVGTDNYSSSKKAVQHLVDQGFKKIAMITIDSDQPQMTDRLRGYEEVLNDNFLVSFTLKLPYRSNQDKGLGELLSFLHKYPELDALYFSTNYLCVKTLKVLQSIGKSTNYGIAAFDDHELFELYTPNITCIRQPLEAIANEIVKMIISRLNDSIELIEECIIPSELIIRASSKK